MYSPVNIGDWKPLCLQLLCIKYRNSRMSDQSFCLNIPPTKTHFTILFRWFQSLSRWWWVRPQRPLRIIKTYLIALLERINQEKRGGEKREKETNLFCAVSSDSLLCLRSEWGLFDHPLTPKPIHRFTRTRVGTYSVHRRIGVHATRQTFGRPTVPSPWTGWIGYVLLLVLSRRDIRRLGCPLRTSQTLVFTPIRPFDNPYHRWLPRDIP